MIKRTNKTAKPKQAAQTAVRNVKISPKHAPHAVMQDTMAFAIQTKLRELGLSWQVLPEASVDFVDGFQPMPDIFVWARPAGDISTAPISAKAVKLVIEIALTSLKADLGPMAEDYAAAGFAEYWVVGVTPRQLHRHAEPGAAGYGRIDVLALAAGFASLTILALALALALAIPPGAI